MKTLVAYSEKCTGCHRCELWCSLIKANVNNPARARIHILRREPSLDAPLVCLQCGICISSCPFGAIERNKKTGAVVIDLGLCTGCGRCMMACPYGMITKEPTARKALKCDLCDGDPECVKHCRDGAIKYADVNKVASERREIYAKTLNKDLKGGSASNLLLG